MGQVLIGDLDDEVLERLKRRASGNHRSLEEELREILRTASRYLSEVEAGEMVDRFRARLEGRTHSDSTELIREDRDR